MIFKNLVFQRVPKENMYKPQMNGFGDKTLPDFQPISMSPAVKDNFRKDKTEVEFIQSFLQSRHCIEISIKHAISKKEQQPKPRHGLNGLWRDLMKYIPQDMCSVEERITLNNMRKFIDIIDALDDDGTKLRYAVQKDGSDSLHTFLWVNTKTIVNQTEAFVKQLEFIEVVSQEDI